MITLQEYLKAKDHYIQDPVSNRAVDLAVITEYNKALVKEYPFLLPRNRFSDEVSKNYDYTYTELDDLADGWRLAFGEDICREIKEELVKYDALDSYRIEQIKVKYGSLRWYDAGWPAGKLSETYRGVDTRVGEPTPKSDPDTEMVMLQSSENVHRRLTGQSYEDYLASNKDAVYHWRIYTITKKCRIPDIVWRYECLSESTCIDCGKHLDNDCDDNRNMLQSPMCDDCKRKLSERLKVWR